VACGPCWRCRSGEVGPLDPAFDLRFTDLQLPALRLLAQCALRPGTVGSGRLAFGSPSSEGSALSDLALSPASARSEAACSSLKIAVLAVAGLRAARPLSLRLMWTAAGPPPAPALSTCMCGLPIRCCSSALLLIPTALQAGVAIPAQLGCGAFSPLLPFGEPPWLVLAIASSGGTAGRDLLV